MGVVKSCLSPPELKPPTSTIVHVVISADSLSFSRGVNHIVESLIKKTRDIKEPSVDMKVVEGEGGRGETGCNLDRSAACPVSMREGREVSV